MDDSDLLAFAPVPLRGRRDGWTPERQRAFIKYLSKGFRPGRAAQRVGMSRQTAYALRSREGAEGFAAAWDEAVAIACRRRAALRPPTEWERAVEGVLRPVRYRGRIVAHERRYDTAALLRALGRIGRLIGNHGAAGAIILPKDAELLSASAPPPPQRLGTAPRKKGPQ
jgi:hypothetical protein